MRYYVTSDVHGFYSKLKNVLTKKGFFDDSEPHKLIICGDLFDRGEEAVELQKFILELLRKEQVILVRGNHEDLALSLINNWHKESYKQYHHHTNGTIDTVCQLVNNYDLYCDTDRIGRAFLKGAYIQRIIPEMVDYFETDHYIFVHGWIPCTGISIGSKQMLYTPIPDWRNADETLWGKARWINGMEAAHHGITEPGKTIVCGHWHCSFGHARYEGDGVEFHKHTANFNPYYGEGIIALDACTAYSGKVNCIVIED